MNNFDLINQIKEGNSNAFSYLVSKHQRLVFGIIWRLLDKKLVEVEDIAQEVFVKIYKNIKSYRQESKLSTWIASIAWKTTIDYHRKSSRSKIDFTDEMQNFDGKINNETLDVLRKKEISEIVELTIEKLPVQYKTVLNLYYMEEFSIPEIHEITEMPEGTIKSNLSRARKALKAELIKLHGKEVVELLYK